MKPSYYLLLASSLMFLLCTASTQAQDIWFSLTKHSDTMILHPVGKGVGPFELRDDRLSNDHLSTSAAWKYTGFKYQEGDKGGAFTLVKSGDGSEVRLKVRHLDHNFLPSIPGVPPGWGIGINQGDMELTISGHGPIFNELRRNILKTRSADAWKSDDLTLHGGVTR